MPPFDFPAAPVLDQVYTANGVSYRYDGSVWLTGDAAATAQVYVQKAGDTMTGPLMLPDPDPTQPLMAGHKRYIDTTVANNALYQGTWQVAANVPDLNVPPNAPLNGYSWVAQTVDPNVPETAPAGIPGIGGASVSALDTVRWNATSLVYEHIRGPVGISQMTIADEPPANAFPGQCWWDSNSGKHYVFFDDGTSSQWVQSSGGGGGTVTGPPDDAPADGNLYGRKDLAWEVVVGGTLAEAPTDGQQYTRGNAAWNALTAATMPPPVVTISDTPPASPADGQLWWNSATGFLYIRYTGQWVDTSSTAASIP